MAEAYDVLSIPANLVSRPFRALSKTDALVLSGAVLLAVVLRAAWVAHSEVSPVEGVDTLWYHAVAESVSLGKGVVNPNDPTSPTALFPPGYSLVLAAAYKLFGAGAGVAQGLNIGLAAVTILVTYLVGRLALGRLAAGIGVLLLAVFPSQVLFSSLVMSEHLFTLLFMMVIASLLLGGRTTGRWSLALMFTAGLIAGAATLVRGQGLILLAVVPAWWFLYHRPKVPLVHLALFFYGVLFTVLPWTIRNWYQLDSPVVVSTNAGWNAAIGHNEAAEGGWMFPGNFFLDLLEVPEPQREVEINERGVRLAWDYARSHPSQEAALSANKAYRLWKTDADAVFWQELNLKPYLGSVERRFLTGLTNSFYAVVLVLAVLGLIVSKSQARSWWLLVLLLVAGWTAFHVLIFAEGRLHYPLSPVLSLAAGAGIVAGANLARRALFAPEPDGQERPAKEDPRSAS